MAIWFSSDLHFNHNKSFIYDARGCDSIEQMNQIILDNFNQLVAPTDDLWLLGDLVMGETYKAHELLTQLPGKKHIILGNHDTTLRTELYRSLGWDCQYATMLKYNKYCFYLSHYPTLVGNFEEPFAPWNLHGHTHDLNAFSVNPRCYNVNVDAHELAPIEINDIISHIKEYTKNV